MKKLNLFYFSSTIILSVIYVSFGTLYTLKHPSVIQEFENMGLPQYILLPLGILKLSAVIVLWSQKKSLLKEWIYSAMFFNILTALFCHIMIVDGEYLPAALALILLVVSYFSDKKKYALLSYS